MPDHKTLIAALDRAKKKVLDNCKCGGSGAIQVQVMSEGGYTVTADMASDACMPEIEGMFVSQPEPDVDVEPCPSCSPVRALDLEWKEGQYAVAPNHFCIACNSFTCHHHNKDLTTEPYKIDGVPQGKLWIVHVMQVLGVWEGFVKWQWNQSYGWSENAWASKTARLAHADILTDGKLLVDAVMAYMEREGV